MFSTLNCRLLLGISLFCLANVLSGSNIIVNGDFEGQGTYVQSIGSVNNVLPNGWFNAAATITKLNRVSAISGFPDPGGGNFYMAFQSPAQDNTQDCLFQDIPTIGGRNYTLTFWLAITQPSNYFQMSPEWDSLGANRQFLPINGYNSGATSDSPVTTGTGSKPFQQYSFVLTASQSVTRLFFHGIDSGGGAVLLDDVSLTEENPIPEPGSYLLVGTTLALISHMRGARARRRR